MSFMARRIAMRFLADQAPGARSRARENTQPVNKPDGISRQIQRENGKTDPEANPDQVKPDRRDIRPKDVFTPTPNDTGVLNLAETGRDLQRAIKHTIPEDEGYDTVRNLSQYLIETEGGGGTEPVGTD